MLSKNQIKLINQLNRKKYRKKQGLFLAEGIKTIKEFLNSDYELDHLYTTADLFYTPEGKVQIITARELKKISRLTTPQMALGVFKIPALELGAAPPFSLVLDGIRDPGNLGTIIRLCDWFGIPQLICSLDTVDCYNPKTVQASMGSLSRVSVIYTELTTYLEQQERPIYGAFMRGTVVYGAQLPAEAVLVMGNEANGIRPEIENRITKKIAIPQFGTVKKTESLNVSTATAILINEFKRNLKI